MVEPIRILHVIGAMDRGGAETMIMNLYREIDRKKYQFDFLVHEERKCDYDEEIEALGGRIFRVPRYRLYNYMSYRKKCTQIIESHPEWKIIHGHIGSCASVYLRVGRSLKRYTIAHSHCVKGETFSLENLIFRILTLDNKKIADFYFGCSELAGLDRYGDKIVASERFCVLKNGIDAQSYCYNEKTQREMKKKLGLENKLVIGHIGRFHPDKNHEFLMQVFKEIADCRSDAEFILVGRGPLEEKIRTLAKRLGIENRTHFLGVREDVPKLMCMMDAFVFPSVSEGLGIVAIEAQAAGLPCVISDHVPDEVMITESVRKLELSLGAKKWASAILEMYGKIQRKDMQDAVKKAGFDIKSSVCQLTEVYDNALK